LKEKYQNLQKFIINSICHFISQIIKNHWNNFNNPNALSQQDLVFEYFINVKPPPPPPTPNPNLYKKKDQSDQFKILGFRIYDYLI